MINRYNKWKQNKDNYILPGRNVDWDLELFDHGYDFSKDLNDPDNKRIIRFVNILHNNHR